MNSQSAGSEPPLTQVTDSEGRRLVTCPADLDQLGGWDSFEDFVDALGDQTDAEVEAFRDDLGLDVVCVPGGSASFSYPFDPETVLTWVYNSEIWYELREEVISQVGGHLAEALERRPAASSAAEKWELENRLRDFLSYLLCTVPLEPAGEDLLFVQPSGEPLTLSGWPIEDADGHCYVERPFTPAAGKSPAVISTDGYVERRCDEAKPTPQQTGVTRPSPTIIRVDLFQFDDPFDAWQIASS